MRKIFLLISIVALSGCAHQTRQQARAAEMQVRAICDSVAGQPEISPLLTNVPIDPSKATVLQLADKSKPTAAQKDIISNIEQYSEPCTQARDAYLAQYAPAASPIFNKLTQDTKLLWARLLNGDLSFGEFNSERAKISASALADAQAAEANRLTNARQLQAQEYQNYLQMQQSINSFKPKTTNCSRYGNNVQCTQY